MIRHLYINTWKYTHFLLYNTLFSRRTCECKILILTPKNGLRVYDETDFHAINENNYFKVNYENKIISGKMCDPTLFPFFAN